MKRLPYNGQVFCVGERKKPRGRQKKKEGNVPTGGTVSQDRPVAKETLVWKNDQRGGAKRQNYWDVIQVSCKVCFFCVDAKYRGGAQTSSGQFHIKDQVGGGVPGKTSATR